MPPFKKKPKSWRPSVGKDFVSPVQQSKIFYGDYSISFWTTPEPAEYDHLKGKTDRSHYIKSNVNGIFCIPTLRLGILPISQRMIIFVNAMNISIVIKEKQWKNLLEYLQSQIAESKKFVKIRVVNEATMNQKSARYLAARKAPPRDYVAGLIKVQDHSKAQGMFKAQSMSIEIDEHLCWILSEFLRIQPGMIDIRYKE
jgi:hypothetical protein